jgi:glutathione S-transferase
MALTLYFHPLSSFCWKVLIGLYENDTPFEPVVVNLGDPASRDPFVALWPMGKFPVVQDETRGDVVPESSVILDYLDLHYPGPIRFVPTDADAALRARKWDRVFDHHVHQPMQKIVGDRIRPADGRDAMGVAQARGQMVTAYGLIEAELDGRIWMTGDAFGLADCAALPALYYGDRVQPLGAEHPHIRAYLHRLIARPSAARVLKEAEPFFKYFPEA